MLALAGQWTDVGIIASIVIIVLLLAFAWATRDRKWRKVRIGFFLERERFSDKEEDE